MMQPSPICFRRLPIGLFVAALLLMPSSNVVAKGLPRCSPDKAGLRTNHLQNIPREVAKAYEAGNFAGCVVAIGYRGNLVYLEAFGDRQVEPTRLPMQVDTLFDMASLTKPIATATSVMVLIERGQIRLRDRLVNHLPDLVGEGTEKITVEQLLTHQAGYVPDNSIKDYQFGVEESWKRLLALKPRTVPGTEFKYSDVGFELLGLLVERVSGQPLDEFSKSEIFTPLGMQQTGYKPSAELKQNVAATEQRDDHWMVGDVHDPRAWLLGGVAGHAGLFSTAEELAIYAQALLNGGEFDGKRILSPAGVTEMTRARDASGVRRTAGWDARSGYSSNRGELLSDRAFGHGGFTGTSMWIDPEQELFVIFLSNRLHPDGKGSVNDLAGRIGAIAASAIIEPK